MTNRIYFAYLLRLWRDQPHTPWQAMLENPRTGERFTFATIADLTRFLADKTERPHSHKPGDPETTP